MFDISFNIPYNEFVARNSSPKSRTLLPATINFKDYHKEIDMTKDITGKRFGRLIALHYDHTKRDKTTGRPRHYWLFKCDCGKIAVLKKENVMSGHTVSCGCYHKERITRHGFSNTRLFNILHDMKCRCYNKKISFYKNYGGRGITLCDEWLTNPESFYTWAINNGYRDNLTIDRIDNDKGYSPENCRWVTRAEQNRNFRRNRLINYNGEVHCLSEWARIRNIGKSTLKQRLDLGWPIEEALGIVERK